ncbi:MAG: hypothetical protein ACLT4C_06595 [Butyricicoccus sp.]
MLEALGAASTCPQGERARAHGNRYLLPVRAGLSQSMVTLRPCARNRERTLFNVLGPLSNPARATVVARRVRRKPVLPMARYFPTSA